MNYGKDFGLYAKSMGVKDYAYKKYAHNMSPFILTEDSNMSVDIYSKLLNDGILFLSGEVDDYMCDLLKAQLLYMESIDSERELKMYINSPGGSVYAGLGLLDTMDFIKNDISTINTGLAASMASVILCSGTKGKRKSLKRARTMLHQPIGGAFGQASDMEIDTKEIINVKKELYEIIADASGQAYDKVHNDCDRDYWMTSEMAKKYGLIDHIVQRK